MFALVCRCWTLDGEAHQIELRHGRKSGIRKVYLDEQASLTAPAYGEGRVRGALGCVFGCVLGEVQEQYLDEQPSLTGPDVFPSALVTRVVLPRFETPILRLLVWTAGRALQELEGQTPRTGQK